MRTAEESLKSLHAGNLRFLRGETTCRSVSAETRRAMLSGQDPLAAVLTCSDARVSPDIIFDAGLGELFVVRIGGAVLDSAGLASLEFAVAELAVPLILVIGHEDCGTVRLAASGRMPPGSIGTLTSSYSMPVSQAKATHAGASEDEVLAEVTRGHALQVAETLPRRSFVISDGVAKGTLHIGAAMYWISTGKVELIHAA